MLDELRQDPITKAWTIIAAGRSKRPHEIKQIVPEAPKDYFCGLCEGHESQKIAPEVFRIGKGKPGKPGWQVRSVLNPSPYFERRGRSDHIVGEELFKKTTPVGTAEVLIETPKHARDLVFMTKEELGEVLIAYQARYNSLIKHWTEVSVFRNHGFLAGQSLLHPHSQIVATKEKSPRNKKEELHGIEYYYAHGNCLYCALIAKEIKKKERVILKSKCFIALSPWASEKPYEVIIFPLKHSANFGEITLAEIRDFTAVLSEILRKAFHGFGDPSYNYFIRSFSNQPPLHNTAHWYLKIIFHHSVPGGYEASSAAFVNPVPPEFATKEYRKIKIDKINWEKEYDKIKKK